MREAMQMDNQLQTPKSEAELQSDVSHVEQEVEEDLKLWANVFASLQNDQKERSYLLRLLKALIDI